MTVAELIEELKKYPPQTPVYVWSFDSSLELAARVLKPSEHNWPMPAGSIFILGA